MTLEIGKVIALATLEEVIVPTIMVLVVTPAGSEYTPLGVPIRQLVSLDAAT